MKAYCVRINSPRNPEDPNPFVWMDEEDEDGNQVQITTDKNEATKTISMLEKKYPDVEYMLVEFDA